MKRLHVRNSEVSMFRKCPALWGFRYAEGLLVDEDVDSKASVGTITHAGLASAWEAVRDARYSRPSLDDLVNIGLTTVEEKLREHEDVDPDTRAAIEFCVEHSLRRCERELAEHVVIAVEADFELVLSSSLAHEGRIDLVTWSPSEQEVITWDHKTTSYSFDAWEQRLELDTQHIGYISAVRKCWPQWTTRTWASVPMVAQASLFRWSVVRSKPPSIPHINKDGTVSAAQIDTTPEVYAAALADQEMRGLPVQQKQRDRLAQLRGAGDRLYSRLDTVVRDDQVTRWHEELKRNAARMRRALKDPAERTRNPESCSSPVQGRCPYRPVCIQPEPEMRALYRKEDSETTSERRLRSGAEDQ